MIAAFLITLREGMEAALIIGIVLGVLRKLGEADRSRSVWAGAVAAVIVSLAVGLVLNVLGVAFEGRVEEVFEGIAMLLAAGVLTWMIFWMQRQGRQIQTELEGDVRSVVAEDSSRALFSLAFVAVVREGIETALFLTAASFNTSGLETLVGGALGLLIAIALCWLVFAAGKQLDVGTFFRVTSTLLIVFAAGLAAHGVHELQEARLLPTLAEHVWDVNHVLDESSGLGIFLKALFGYNGNPSLLEVLTYVGYFVVIAVLGSRSKRRLIEQRAGA